MEGMNKATKVCVVLGVILSVAWFSIGCVDVWLGELYTFKMYVPLALLCITLFFPYIICESLIAEKTTTMTQYDVYDIWEKDYQVFITYKVNNKEFVKIFPRNKTTVCEVLETDERYGTCEEWEYLSEWWMFKTYFTHYKIFI